MLAAEKTNPKNNAVVEQLKKDVSTVTVKTADHTDALTTSLVQDAREIEVLKKKSESAI